MAEIPPVSAKIIIEVDAELEDLIPGFLLRRQQEVQTLREALDMADFDQICLLAHGMKGVGGGYGFDAITDLGQKIQQAAESRTIVEIEAKLTDLADYLERVEVVFI